MAAAQPHQAASTAAKQDKSATRGDLLPVEILIAIFVVVEVFIIWLMAPQFLNEYTRWKSLRYQRQGDYRAAAAVLHKLVASPQGARNPTFLAELANAYLCLGEYDKAIEYFQRAQENRMVVAGDQGDEENGPREYPDFNSMIGLAYFRKGDLDNAEKYFKQGLEANRLDKLAHFHLGVIEFKRGNYLKAVEYFKFVASDPGYAKEVREYYRKIEAELFKGIE